MKTLSEHEAEQQRMSLEWVEHCRRQRQQLLQQLAEHGNPPLYQAPPPPPINSTDYAKAREELRRALADDHVNVLEVVCDHCHTSLVDRQPGSLTASYPPQRTVGCPGCGWLGWMRA